MPLFVDKFDPDLNIQWDKFVQESDNGTIFHQRRFLEYHKKEKFTDHSLIIRKHDQIVGLIPFNEIHKDGQVYLYSHQGTSFGGVVYKNLNLQKSLDYVSCLRKYFQRNSIKHVCINNSPNIYKQNQNDYIEYALLKNGLKHSRIELTSIIDINRLQENFILDFNNKARTNIRKAINNKLSVSFTDDVKAFNSILETTFREKHQIKPTHSLKEIETLLSLFPNEIRIMGVYKELKMIGGALLFLCNARVVLTFYLVANQEYQDLRPLNILVYELVKWVRAEDFLYIDFGTITKHDYINLGLAKFKENFSSFGIFRNSLSLDL